MMNCKSFNKNLNEYIENETTGMISEQMKKHRDHCENCRNLYEEKIEVRNSLLKLFSLNNVDYISQKKEIINKLDSKYYSKSFISKFKYHFRRNILSYSSSMAVAVLLIYV